MKHTFVNFKMNIFPVMLSLVFFISTIAFAAAMATSEEKKRVAAIMAEVSKISKSTEDLNEFGKMSMQQASALFAVGSNSIYVLSLYTGSEDWKIRFWIADILGFMDNPDAQRPLLKMYRNPFEKDIIRKRALSSLYRLGVFPVDKKLLREGKNEGK